MNDNGHDHDDDDDTEGEGLGSSGHGETKSLVSMQLAALLEANGIPRHKQTRLVADLLQMGHPSARRKVNGSAEPTEAELRKILRHIGYTWNGLEGISKDKPELGKESAPKKTLELELEILGAPMKAQVTTHWPLRRIPPGARSIGLSGIEEGKPRLVHHRSPKTGELTYAVQNIEIGVSYERTGAHVAVLDDDETVVTLMCRNLDKSGFKASGFTTIEQILEEVGAGHSFDAFILDWSLQSARTVEPLIRELREKEPTSPIIIMSGRMDDEDFESAISEAAVVYGAVIMPKPCPIIAITQQLLKSIPSDEQTSQ